MSATATSLGRFTTTPSELNLLSGLVLGRFRMFNAPVDQRLRPTDRASVVTFNQRIRQPSLDFVAIAAGHKQQHFVRPVHPLLIVGDVAGLFLLATGRIAAIGVKSVCRISVTPLQCRIGRSAVR